jgi:hypothetical protein
MSRESDKPVQPPSSNTIPSAESIKNLPSYSARNTKIFKAIIEFTDQLNESFGKDDVNILKVYRIINKTPLTNRKVIDRHLVIFHTFLDENRAAIIARKPENFVMEKIELTEKIFMNLKETMVKCDDTSRKAIWQHLFNIMYLFNPEDETIKIELKASMAEQETKENRFLMDTFSKFEKAMNDNKKEDNAQADPMAMVSNLMQSGFLNDMIGNINNGVSSGNLDIKNLIGTVQNLLGNLAETIDKEDKTKK